MSEFSKISLTLPADLNEILRKLAADRRLPISRLIWYALDNELESPNPFNYECPEPETVFVQYAYSEEAKKIYDFLRKFPEGLNTDMIMLMRRQIGLPNKITLMLALRELLNTTLVVESKVPPKGRFFAGLNPDLTWIRLSKETQEHLARQRKVLDAKKSKLEKKESRLEYKETLLKPIKED